MAYEKLYELLKNAKNKENTSVEFINKEIFESNKDLNFVDTKENISSEEDLKDKLISN
jgi:hypothetical protein